MSAATLRRLAMATLVVAIGTGTVSLFLLLSGRSSSPVLVIISACSLLAGMVLDRFAARADQRSQQ